MNRVLLIDRDLDFTRAVGMACLRAGIAVRMAENLCEGVRYMLHTPVSAVLIEAGLLRLGGPEQVRLFELVAPGVPVIVTLPEGGPTEDRVRLELQGFSVVTRPFDITGVLGKIEPAARPGGARRPATAEVEAFCS